MMMKFRIKSYRINKNFLYIQKINMKINLMRIIIIMVIKIILKY
jgi:hypothetical protein